MQSFDFMKILLVFIPMLLSLTVHEYAHAFVAYRLGDDTARLMGRMTLNPMSHIDPIGTVLIPLIGLVSGFPFFGWARPVPINPVHFTRRLRMKTSILLTAVAGPLSNLMLALLMAGALALLGPFVADDIYAGNKGILVALTRLAGYTLLINLVLMFFNLIPVPPLDGSKVLAGFLPDRAYPVLDFIGKYSFVLFLGILVFGGRLIWPAVQSFMELLASLGVPIHLAFL
ncbi:MAG: site-2 protease family protein [Myxococcales bacterium]|nr:site-2 protease family protein [Myxococcales bacterium]